MIMEAKKEKKGLLKRFLRSMKPKKSSCCGGFEVEEIPEENADNEKKLNEDKSSPCCK